MKIKESTLLFAHVFILIAICFAVYSQSLDNPIESGDEYYEILANPLVHDISLKGFVNLFVNPIKGVFYSPIKSLSYWINYAVLKDGSIYLFHLSNNLIHAAAVVGCYYLLLFLSGRGEFSLLASMLFAIHPSNGLTINNLGARGHLLSVTFAIWSLAFYILSARRAAAGPKIRNTTYYYALSVLLYTFSLLSWPRSLALPLLLLGYEIFARNDENVYEMKIIDRLKRPLPFIFISTGFYMLMMKYVFSYTDGHSILFTKAFGGISGTYRLIGLLYEYLALSISPTKLSIIYGIYLPDLTEAGYYLSRMAIFGFIAALIYFLYKKQKWMLVAPFIFLTLLLPNILFIPQFQTLAGRYLYGASIGVYMLVVGVMELIAVPFLQRYGWYLANAARLILLISFVPLGIATSNILERCKSEEAYLTAYMLDNNIFNKSWGFNQYGWRKIMNNEYADARTMFEESARQIISLPDSYPDIIRHKKVMLSMNYQGVLRVQKAVCGDKSYPKDYMKSFDNWKNSLTMKNK